MLWDMRTPTKTHPPALELVQESATAETNVLRTLRSIAAVTAAINNLEEARRELVDQAHTAGVSWTRIASFLGVTRQAAAERYRP